MANGKRNDNKRNQHKGSSQKGKKRQVPRDRDQDKTMEDRSIHHGSNDPSWYALDPQMLADVASIPYSHPLGSVTPPLTDNQQFTDGSYERSFPGVMTIGITMLPGVSSNNASPINVAARNVYSYYVHANSRNTKYNSPDTMMYNMAADSIYAFWAYMVRAYGVLCNYKVYNKFYAEGVFTAMKLNYADFARNMADFRAYINMFAHKATKICVPASITYMLRHMWLFSHIWKDSESKKAQTYMYVPDGFWTFDEMYETGGRLVFKKLPYGTSFSELKSMGDALLANVIESEDCMIMSGDILKAFGPEKLVGLGTIPETLILDAEYDAEVCSQIQNAYLVGTLNDFDIHQDPTTNAIICEPSISGRNYWPQAIHLNHRADFPTPAETMVATRLIACIGSYDSATNATNISTCGSEIATNGEIYYYSVMDLNRGPELRRYVFTSFTNLTANGTGEDVAYGLIMLEKFDWHPTQYVLDSTGAEIGVSGDVDNYTRLNRNDLAEMHQLALITEFNVPTMGPFSMR